jgi:hypothetical protein
VVVVEISRCLVLCLEVVGVGDLKWWLGGVGVGVDMFELLIAWCPFVVYSPLYRSV